MIIPPLPTVIPTPTFNPPTPSFTNIQGSINGLATLVGRDGPECTDISRYCTTTNIVLSCLSTIFACTFAALHLNVPKNPNQSMWRSSWKKSRWMIYALIVPEFVVMRAMDEFFTAMRYMDNWNANFVSLCSPNLIEIPEKTIKQYKDELKYKHYNSRWTLTHGFLARMGGIRLYKDGDDYIRDFLPTKVSFKDPKMRPIIQQIGLISSKDIEDKSKGDWISKLFVVIQTTWFTIQCLARWVTHLPVTELEVVTLAYAVLNVFIYVLWWSKPQGLSVPYRFYLPDGSSENLEARGGSKQDEVSLMPYTLPDSETCWGRSQRGRKRSVSEREWVQPTCSGVRGFFITGVNDGGIEWFFLILVGTIFGGFHLIPIWLSVFPSNVEKILWRVSAFLGTTLPAGLALAVLPNWGISCTSGVGQPFPFFIMGTYAVARIILLALPFTTLRSLPAEAFLSVAWTRFIPHF